MKDNYPKAYKEVYEILKYVPKESVEKIPQDMRDMFKNKMDIAYHFEIDTSKSIEEQTLLKETKAILANLYEDYWATPEERAEIRRRDRAELQKIEEEKQKKYNVDVFAARKNNENLSSNNTTTASQTQETDNYAINKEKLPVEKKEGFVERVKRIFKGLFGK